MPTLFTSESINGLRDFNVPCAKHLPLGTMYGQVSYDGVCMKHGDKRCGDGGCMELHSMFMSLGSGCCFVWELVVVNAM